MWRTWMVAVTLVLAVAGSDLSAQSRGASGGKRALWTAVGAGAGFGVGAYFGLRIFDDATNSDRKVWTTALVSAGVGGALGYLFSRGKSRPNVTPGGEALRLPDREIPVSAEGVPLLGSGRFGGWLRSPIPEPRRP